MHPELAGKEDRVPDADLVGQERARDKEFDVAGRHRGSAEGGARSGEFEIECLPARLENAPSHGAAERVGQIGRHGLAESITIGRGHRHPCEHLGLLFESAHDVGGRGRDNGHWFCRRPER